MTVARLKTWSPLVLIEIVEGNLTTEDLAGRILSLTYTDRDKDYDHIELECWNGDGVLSRPETLGVGVLMRIKMGYIDSLFPWKAFIINRLRGGTGVYGVKDPAVGENEQRLTLYGRNRNAPGGRPSRRWKRGSPSWSSGKGRKKVKAGGKRKTYPPTKDITKYESLLKGEGKPQLVKCSSTSDGIQKIAARQGFKGANVIIQPTRDSCTEMCVPLGVPDGVFMQKVAKELDYVCKIEGDTFRFHSRTYKGAKYIVLPTLRYGGGPDIISLNMDVDFRLPIPIGVRTRAYNDNLRTLVYQDTTGDKAIKDVQAGTIIARLTDKALAVLTRTDTVPVVADSKPMSKEAAQRRFLKRHMNSFQITLQCTGNPDLLAGRLLPLKGTGNPIFDRVWYIKEARHMNNGETYITEVQLKQAPRRAMAAGGVAVGLYQNQPGDKAIKKVDVGQVYYKLTKSMARALRGAR